MDRTPVVSREQPTFHLKSRLKKRAGAGFVKGYSVGFGTKAVAPEMKSDGGIISGMALDDIKEEDNYNLAEPGAVAEHTVMSPSSIQNPQMQMGSIRVSGKSSAQPGSSTRQRINRAAIVSPEANSYESEYDSEYASSSESSSKSK